MGAMHAWKQACRSEPEGNQDLAKMLSAEMDAKRRAEAAAAEAAVAEAFLASRECAARRVLATLLAERLEMQVCGAFFAWRGALSRSRRQSPSNSGRYAEA